MVARRRAPSRAGGGAHAVCGRKRPRRGGAARTSRRHPAGDEHRPHGRVDRETWCSTRSGGVRSSPSSSALRATTAATIARCCSAMLRPEDRVRLPAAIEAALKARSDYQIEFEFQHGRTGEWRWMEARGRAEYGADGRATRLYGLAIDITERRRTVEALQEADRRKDEFLATLAHELRNPLAPISSGLHILRTAPSPEQSADRAGHHGAAGRPDGAAGGRPARCRAHHDRKGRLALRAVRPGDGHPRRGRNQRAGARTSAVRR